MNNMYSGLATFGKNTSFVMAVFISAISLVALGFGIYYIFTTQRCNKLGCKDDYKYYGIALITGAVVFSGLAWLIYYINSKSKTISAINGASDILQLF